MDIVGAPLVETKHYDFSTNTYTGVDQNLLYAVGFDSENGLELESGTVLLLCSRCI